MKGRYAGASMRVYGAILPGAARLARLPAEPSPKAKRRLNVIQWYEKHERRVRLTARYFGFSPDTISRWARAYAERGVGGLEPGSRRPKRVRQPQTPPAVVLRIQALRERYPSWGRETLRLLLLREGIQISAKSIDLGGLQAALIAWNQVYDTVRPHQPLGYLTPEQFYQNWLSKHCPRKEGVSDMS